MTLSLRPQKKKTQNTTKRKDVTWSQLWVYKVPEFSVAPKTRKFQVQLLGPLAKMDKHGETTMLAGLVWDISPHQNAGSPLPQTSIFVRPWLTGSSRPLGTLGKGHRHNALKTGLWFLWKVEGSACFQTKLTDHAAFVLGAHLPAHPSDLHLLDVSGFGIPLVWRLFRETNRKNGLAFLEGSDS